MVVKTERDIYWIGDNWYELRSAFSSDGAEPFHFDDHISVRVSVQLETTVEKLIICGE